MRTALLVLGLWLAGSSLNMALAAGTTHASRFDPAIQAKVAQLTTKNEFSNVEAAAEDGIVTLTGEVDLYQQKLDAAKKVRKLANVQGVRNLIAVRGNVSDAQLTATLARPQVVL